MRIIYWDLENGVKKLNSDYEDIYFLLHVLYNAKTELYDRTLTDMRSRYDPTEAFINAYNKKWSDWYAINLYKKCYKCIELATFKPFNNEKWINYKWRYKLSAQGWINLYQQLLQENRYEDWIMKETCIIKDEELVTEYCRSDGRIKMDCIIENMKLEKQINHNGNGDDHLLNISFITEDNHKTIKWKAKVLLPFCKSGVTFTKSYCGNSLLNFGFGDLPCVEDPKYEIIKEKKQDMTLEEIEERLGYKIRIVSDDK